MLVEGVDYLALGVGVVGRGSSRGSTGMKLLPKYESCGMKKPKVVELVGLNADLGAARAPPALDATFTFCGNSAVTVGWPSNCGAGIYISNVLLIDFQGIKQFRLT